MDAKLLSNNYPFGNNRHEFENDHSPENSADSPDQSPLCFTNDTKIIPSTSSPKRSRRAIQKRVMSVPIKDGEGSRFKGESSPPSDSWAWRKYGQKPIKGSPYPRGYYRCSSSKGCPARKQVERSRLDPTMLVITYSCEHNHSAPTTNRNSHHNSSVSVPAAAVAVAAPATPQLPPASTASNYSESEISTVVFVNELEPSLAESEGFRWFSDLEATSSAGMLESPMILSAADGDMDMAAMMYSMRGGGGEDDSLFADLGELPECSVVFRRGTVEKEEELRRRISVAPWCGTSG